MKQKTFSLLGLVACLLTGCYGGGQSIFYWQKEGVGPTWFAKDHNECLAGADWWPWSMPAWPPGTNKLPELRFDNNADNGIWANYVPYPGAQPVYVNSLANDATMSPSSYRRCMEKKGYVQRQPMVKRRQVLPE